MKGITYNEVNNCPKYKAGDIIGAYLFNEYVVASINAVEVEPLSPFDLEKSKKNVHKCCGITEFDIPLNKIKYVTRLGGVYEGGIKDVGLEAIQQKIRGLEALVKDYERTLEGIRDLI